MKQLSQQIAASVTELYERYPYPMYPLLAKPLWQEGYLTPSKFAAKLFEDLTGQEAAINTARGQFVKQSRTILVAGAGEVLPYVIRKNEPSAHKMLCVDLSQHSLRRAQWRLLGNLRPTQFIRSDINQFLEQQGAVSGPYDHIDAYGVLHHLADPTETIRLLGVHLSGHGTMRVMVYNSRARRWIHHLQSVFRLLRFSAYERRDIKAARRLLETLSELSPQYRRLLSQVGRATIDNDARLADTFFHCREIRQSLKQWFSAFEQAGLKPFALLDRYGELDELENPMWKCPSADELQLRADRDEFQNNLEIFLYKPRKARPLTKDYSYERKPDRFDVWSHYLRQAPRAWFAFDETRHLGWWQQQNIWWRHFETAYKIRQASLHFSSIELATYQRLARLGAIFPSQFTGQRQLIQAPLIEVAGSNDESVDRTNFAKSSLVTWTETQLRDRGIYDVNRHQLILQRLNKGQF